MDRLTEMACYLHKIRDLAIENSLRLVACILAPLLAFSGPIIIWPQKKIKRLTAAFVRCREIMMFIGKPKERSIMISNKVQ